MKGRPTILTPAGKRYIKANYLKMSGADIARKIGFDKGIVYRFCANSGLKIPKRLKEKFRKKAQKAGKEIKANKTYRRDDKYILENYLSLPVKRIGKYLGRDHGFIVRRLRYHGLRIPKKLAKERQEAAQFKPGMEPKNKGKRMKKSVYKRVQATMFKKGHLPANTL